MANRWFTQFIGTLEKKPVLLSCNFVVDSTNSNGLGQSSLKGPGIQQVYMHTSATPAAGNPNPPAGYAIIQLQDCYNRYLSKFSGLVSPLSGSALTSVTSGDVYVITALGTATLAQWQAKGLPVGITPAVGVPFVATATGTIGGSAAVQVPSVSGISAVEVIGSPDVTLTSNASSKAQILGVQSGAYLMVQFLGATSATDTTLIPTAPADGSIVELSFYLSNSVIKVQGE
jgi:hypothetical protein